MCYNNSTTLLNFILISFTINAIQQEITSITNKSQVV